MKRLAAAAATTMGKDKCHVMESLLASFSPPCSTVPFTVCQWPRPHPAARPPSVKAKSGVFFTARRVEPTHTDSPDLRMPVLKREQGPEGQKSLATGQLEESAEPGQFPVSSDFQSCPAFCKTQLISLP